MSKRREREEDDDYEEGSSSKSESQSSASGESESSNGEHDQIVDDERADEEDQADVMEEEEPESDGPVDRQEQLLRLIEREQQRPAEPLAPQPREVIIIDDDEEPEQPRRVRRNQLLVQAPEPRRGPARRGRENYVDAFQLLRDDNLNGFLNHWIIQRDLAPAFDLLGNFGQGHRQEAVTAFWHLHWRGALFCRKLIFARIRGSCCACALRRNLKYCFYLRDAVADDEFFQRVDDQDDGGIKLLGLMGTHCFEIKFRALMLLADVCLDLLDDLNRPDFNVVAPATFARALERVREAPALMKQTYD